MIIDAQLVAEALEEIKPHDTSGEMACRINEMMDIKEATETLAMTCADRGKLALVITGEDDTAVQAMATAYAKALHGHGLTFGKDDPGKPVVESIDWTAQITDITATRSLQEHSWANTKMYEAKGKAEGGVLIVKDINDIPYAGYPDEEDANPKAVKGGLDALSTFMVDYAKEDYIPVIVLTGKPGAMQQFFDNHPDIARLFEGKTVEAGAPAPPPAPISTALESSMKISKPLKLRSRAGLIS